MKKPITVPAGARWVYEYRNPKKPSGHDLVLLVRATKARNYVWQDGEWSIRTAEETRAAIASAEASRKYWEAGMRRLDKVRDFVERAQELRKDRELKAELKAALLAIEELHLRKIISAKSLAERIAIDDEKEGLLEQIEDSIFEDGSLPDLPDDWVIVSANPSKRQYNMKL